MAMRVQSAGPGSRREDSATKLVHAAAAPMGLKEFSKAVWNKVMERGETDYHEVAEDMLADIKRTMGGDSVAFDERNVRRRVYDALNVLMAVGVIEKDKAARKIFWKGVSSARTSEADALERSRDVVAERVAQKRRAVQCLLQRKAGLKALVQRNQLAMSRPVDSALMSEDAMKTVPLPFVAVEAPAGASVFVNWADEKKCQLTVACDRPLTISSHTAVLDALGWRDVSCSDIISAAPACLSTAPEEIHRIIQQS